MDKQEGLMLSLPTGQLLLPGVEPAQVILQHIATDKTYQWIVGGDQRVYRQFGFFLLCIAHRCTVGGGVMYRPAVEDHPVDTALMQPLIQQSFFFPLAKECRVADFHSVGKLFWQGVKKLPHCR
ncbi:hypothetical protein D3C75_916910 [compost metagenome]